jgi:hypothetical protein
MDRKELNLSAFLSLSAVPFEHEDEHEHEGGGEQCPVLFMVPVMNVMPRITTDPSSR